MEILSNPTPDMLVITRFDDGTIVMQELFRRLTEQVVNDVMDAEAHQPCGGGANSRNGRCEQSPAACVGMLTPHIPSCASAASFRRMSSSASSASTAPSWTTRPRYTPRASYSPDSRGAGSPACGSSPATSARGCSVRSRRCSPGPATGAARCISTATRWEGFP